MTFTHYVLTGRTHKHTHTRTCILYDMYVKVGGGERLKRQRSERSNSSFKSEAAGSKAEQDREKNELVKEEVRYRFEFVSFLMVLLKGGFQSCAGGVFGTWCALSYQNRRVCSRGSLFFFFEE